MHACGTDPEEFKTVEFFASHEALLLDYESALTRVDSRTGKLYDVSGAHGLDRRAHPPAGRRAHRVRLAGSATRSASSSARRPRPRRRCSYIDRLDPDREPGRLTFIVRMGADKVRDKLPELVEKVTASGAHGRLGHATRCTATPSRRPPATRPAASTTCWTRSRASSRSTRRSGTHPGGIHVELTGDDVTECVGGGDEIFVDDLHQRYETACDPRLNRSQSLDLAFLVAEMYRDQ